MPKDRCPRSRRRRGTAVVEMAVVSPLLLTLVFGIIEFSWAMSVNQTLTQAAREGCRTAIIKGTTDSDITSRVATFMSASGLTGYTVDLTRATVDDPTETVRVSIPYGNVSLICGYFPILESKTLTSACSMRKEGS
ncbi:MAG: pilus assembly protein [Phycisphaerae bacterium]|nr:pilus assembly protein [Phycisphaerae bacterium]